MYTHTQKVKALITLFWILTFATAKTKNLVLNWHVNDQATTESDHELIQFAIATDNIQWVETAFSMSYNMQKANWDAFSQELKALFIDKYSQMANPLQKSSITKVKLKEAACLLRNTIMQATEKHILRRQASSRSKV